MDGPLLHCALMLLLQLLRECIVYVVVPHDKAMLNRINRMAQYVVNEGPMFEAMIMNKELNNDKVSFQFLEKLFIFLFTMIKESTTIACT